MGTRLNGSLKGEPFRFRFNLHDVATLPPGRILVADDEPLIRELILDVFANEGYDLTVVRNGAEAVDALRGAHVDLLLLDVDMPILDGFGVIDFLRGESEASRPRVLVMTIFDDHIEEVDWSIIDAVVPKPFEVPQLRALVKNAMSARGRLSGEDGASHFSPRTRD